jgi:hypothetical protein
MQGTACESPFFFAHNGYLAGATAKVVPATAATPPTVGIAFH